MKKCLTNVSLTLILALMVLTGCTESVRPTVTPAPEKMVAPVVGKTDPTTGMEFVFVKGGCFQMGDTFGNGGSDDKPVHEVCVTDFSLGKYEVTQGQWLKVMGSNPSAFKDCGSDCPVENVSWNMVQEFIKKLNGKSGTQYRLPTEAEWEYAARSGGKKEKWAGMSDEGNLKEFVWLNNNSAGITHPVGQKKSNGLGIYDMSGNVYEWCQDWYHETYYGKSPKDNPQGSDSGTNRVLRGGSWADSEYSQRTYARGRDEMDGRSDNNGFRLLLPVK